MMQHLWVIPLLPLAGFAINGLFGRRLSRPVISAIAVLTVLMALIKVVISLNDLGAFSGGLEQAHVEHYFTWIQSGALSIGADFAIDRLTAVMLLIVTGIGTLIHIYAVGYMAHEADTTGFSPI
jgi:NADH-quinone oxidoreductase subunit L